MGLLECIERALETDKGNIVINDLQLPVRLTYYILNYGLKKHDMNQHQIRKYIHELILKDYEEWSRANKTEIEVQNKKIIERRSS